ncbi:MAG: BON domain-containing protein, partial [Elusimicrobia bacterium]|nr:BON domain-containing protein [Elusimicrobiota bacterium]
MKNSNALVAAAAAAGATLLLDPDTGSRRRARMAQAGIHLAHKIASAGGKTRRDLMNRTRGVVAHATARFRPEVVADDVLAERVRSALGRLSAHTRAVDVSASAGFVRLAGAALAGECDDIVAAVRLTRGVRAVENNLDLHESPDAPALRGAVRPPAPRRAWSRRRWSPAFRFVAGLTGGTFAIVGIRRGHAFGAMVAGLGLAVAARSAINAPLKEVAQAGRKRISEAATEQPGTKTFVRGLGRELAALSH